MCLALATPGRALAVDWMPSTGPEGGNVTALAEAPDGTLYAGTRFAGAVYTSTDDGVTWSETDPVDMNVNGIVVTNDGTVLVGLTSGSVLRSVDAGGSWTHVGFSLVTWGGALAHDETTDAVFAAGGVGLSRSTNGGETWSTVSTALPFDTYHALAVAPGGTTLFLATQNLKIHRSTDGGVTWAPFDAGVGANWVTDLLLVAPDTIYAATYGTYVLESEWTGTTWTAVGTGMGSPFCATLARDGSGRLWVGSVEEGIYVLPDGSTTWSHVDTGVERQEVLAILPMGGDVVLAGSDGGGVHRTTDTGGTWTPSNTGLVSTDVRDFELLPFGEIWAVTSGAGAFRSTDDGVTWTQLNNGLTDYNLAAVTSRSGDPFVGGWEGELYHSTDGGVTWTRADTGLGVARIEALAYSPSGVLYAGGSFGGGVWRSPDDGATWSAVGPGITDDNVFDLAIDGNGDVLATTQAAGIFRSTNDGDSWSPINNGLTDLWVDQVIAASPTLLFAATQSGLFRSLDNGASWAIVDTSLPASAISAIAVNAAGDVFVAPIDIGHIYRSTNGGDTWELIANGSWTASSRCLGVDQNGRLLVGTGGRGVMLMVPPTPVLLSVFAADRAVSGDVTLVWRIGTPADDARFDVFRESGSGERVRVTDAPLTGGPDFTFVDSRAPAETVSYWLRVSEPGHDAEWFGPVVVDPAAPLVTRLDAVSPNPIRRAAEIRFTLRSSGPIELDVFDVRGALVRRLAEGPWPAGSNRARWDGTSADGRQVASGVYFVRLRSEGTAVTRSVRMVGER